MKATNSKYTMFAKRVATMVVAMFMGLTAWGKDYTLVTNVSSLSTNDKVVILATNDANALAGANGVTGYNNNKDATVATSGWKEYKVAKTNSTFTLEDVAAEQFIASPGGNEFKYGDTGGACSVDANGRLICNTRYLASNSGAYRFYGTSQSYPAFYVWKVGASDPQTVNFNAHGGICGTISLTEESGDAGVELPSASPNISCAAEGWAFYGWAANEVTSSTTTAPTIVGKAGDMYYPTSATTLHAVYCQVTEETSTATFNASTLAGLTQKSADTKNPARYEHNASGIELYINYYGIYQSTWDFDAYYGGDEAWGYIQSSSNIQSISINYSGSTKLDHVDQDAGTATLSANKQTIDCTGDVKKVYLYPPSEQESQVTAFTVTYYAVNYFSSPSCCDKIVELSKGTETNATISSFSPESVPTCGNDASREVTIVAAANTGYKFDNGATLGYSGVGSATLVSATNGTAPYTWVYRLSANATGDGSFSVTSATPKSYAITLNGNGATEAGTASVNATYNSADLSSAITNPKKTDYIFDGWYSEEGGSGSLIIDKTGALQANVANYTGAEGIWTRDAATTLYAKWNEHTYVNFRTNCCTEYEVELASSGVATGGTFEASKTSVCEGKEVTLTATPGTGYEFDAWTVYKKGDTETPVSVSNNKFEMPAYDVTVEAAFELIEYGITYHLGGGTNHANNPASYYYTSDEITLEDPSYAGHAFLGWYDNSSFEGDAVTTIPNHSTGNIELWANWIEDTQRPVTITAPTNGTITVSWNSGSNSFSSGSQNIEIGTELTIEAAGATGYDAGTITVNGTPLVGSTYELGDEALTIAASFSIHNYSITYNLDGGEGATNTTYTYESEAITLPTAPTVHKTGYTFMGWFDNFGFEGDAVTTIPNHSTGDKQFWAKWQINNYTLTWTTDGDELDGNYTGKSGKVDFGTAIVAPTTPTKTGYTFAGWSPAVAATMPAEDVEYTATWTKNNYHVYFQNNGVTINEYTKEVAYEAQIGALPDGSALTACDGSEKVFKGWTATPISGTRASAPSYAASTDGMGAEDLYLHAVFAAETAGPASSPISVFTQSGIGDPTSGYELILGGEAEKPKNASYYQDGGGDAGTKRWVQIKKKNTSSAMISTTPKTVTVTARLGGGTAKNPLGNSVCAIWLDASGNELGDPVVLTNAITAAGGSDFSANLPVTSATSAYGVRIYHSKESGYNVRYYGVSLSYTVSSVDYSDYMTHCCSLVAVEDLAAVDNTSDTEVTLNWTALSSANQEGVTKLQVVDANNVVKVDNIAADAATATVTGLTKCDTYSFRVATVGASCTTYSEAVDARPFGSAKTVSFNYNYDGGAGSATSETTTCDESSVTLATPDSRSGYRFMGWYNGDDKVGDANASYTPSASIELQAHWAQEYTLHYDYNGAAGAPEDAKYIAGETVTLPANPTKNYLSPFQEWSYSTAVTVTAGTFPMPASDLIVTAVFGGLQGQWFLVTDESELQANDKVIIAAKEYDYAMSTTQNSNNRGKIGITKKGNVIYSPADAVQIFELEAVNTGTWAFKCLNGDQTNKYLYAASSTSNHLKSQNLNDANGEWDLDIAIGKATAQGTNSNKVMRYNTDGMFSCYGSATQKAIAFYHFVEGTFNEVTVPAAEDVIGGTITADQVFVKAGETVTLTYTPKRGYTVGTLTVTGASGSVAVSPTIEAGVTEYTFTMPAEGVTVAATFNALPPVVYNLMEDPSTLIMGQQFVFVGTTALGTDARVAGAINNNRLSADAINDGAINTTDKTLSLTDEAAVDYIIEGEPGAYKIMNEGMFLKEATSNKIAWDATGRVWNIAIEDNKTVISTTVGSDTYKFQYNTSGDYFTAYTSDQQPIYIYTLPTETYNLQFKEEDNTVIKTIKVAEGYTYEYTIKSTDRPSVIPETYEFLMWTDGTNRYKTGDVVTVSAETILKPCWKVTPTEAVIDIDDLPESVTEIVVSDGKDLNVNDDRTINTLTIKSTSGAFEVDGTSGQLTGGNTLTVTDNLFLEIKLCDGDMDAEASRKWYCIAAPFDVNINGGFFWGDGTPMVLNTHFQLFEWDGDRRATGASGWRRTSGIMKKDTAYFIGFDDERANQNTIKLKAMNNTISNRAKIVAPEHTGSAEAATYGNWNGLANPNFHHIALNKNVQAFDYNKQGYSPYETDEYNFVVGTPFFIQYAGDIAIEAADNAYYRAPKREDEKYSYSVRIGSADASRADNRIIVRASETASAEFDNEHDMITLNNTTSNYGALLWTENYGGKRLAIEEAPLVNGTASYVLTMSAPQAGTYSISVAAPKENADLYLTYEGSIIWNLSMGEYTLDLNKGITNGYGLILRANAPSAATGVENGEVLNGANGVQKIILDEKVFILRGGKMYDVTGKAVK